MPQITIYRFSWVVFEFRLGLLFWRLRGFTIGEWGECPFAIPFARIRKFKTVELQGRSGSIDRRQRPGRPLSLNPREANGSIVEQMKANGEGASK